MIPTACACWWYRYQHQFLGNSRYTHIDSDPSSFAFAEFDLLDRDERRSDIVARLGRLGV